MTGNDKVGKAVPGKVTLGQQMTGQHTTGQHWAGKVATSKVTTVKGAAGQYLAGKHPTGTILGLDSGGTKTLAALADRSGTVVDLTFGAGLDPTADPAWPERLAAIVTPLGPVDAAVLGLPFHGEMAALSARQTQVAQDLLGAAAVVLNDVAVAFEGAFGGSDGVLILAGTGSMAWAQGPNGTTRSGGWGAAFGDEGSAHWIGREALALVSMDLDGRQPCAAFGHGLLQALGIGPDDLIGWAYGQTNPRETIASVARHVAALAATDPDAQALMRRAAAHLTALGQATARSCGAVAPLRWSYAGGVFSDPVLRQTVAAQLGSEPVRPGLPPVGGALLLAARTAGWTVDAKFTQRLNASLTSKIPLQPQEVTQ